MSNAQEIINQKQLTLEQIQKCIEERKLKKCCIREGCEDINNYKSLNKIHQGNYGIVYRAIQLPTSKIYAIKKLKLEEGHDFPITSLRQVSILKSLNHPNIIQVTRVAGSEERDKVYIVMQYVENEMKQLLNVISFTQSQVKRLMKDLLEGINYLHERKIVHRDLKTSNLLYSNSGVLKICDFGLARKASLNAMTQQVITMWYRPPQLFLGTVNYSTEVDIWSIGCIMGEFILRQALFKGKSQLQQLDIIFKTLGSPNEQTWPQFKSLKNAMYVIGRKYQSNKLRQMIKPEQLTDEGLNLLSQMLISNPKRRITAKKALSHPWFKSGVCEPADMPKHDSLNALGRGKKKVKKNDQ